MNEEEIFGEQSEIVEPSQEDTIVDSPSTNEVVKALESEAERGVPVGKFKSVEDLEKAYNNLQSEFTKKCQKLAELQKDKLPNQSNENKFDEDFKAFLVENQEAYLYADQIKSAVANDESLKNDEHAFDKVWAKMIYEKFSGPNKTNEPLVQNFILNDENLKNLVIENYLKQLQANKMPFVMSSGAGERVTKTVAPKPDSFEKAKQVVLDLIS